MPEPDMSVWTGRVDAADGPRALRWHQMVKPLSPDCQPGIVLIGFACDEGVRRNGGRVGAKDGPRAIRAALANLAWHQDRPVYDAGDVRCDDSDMEGAQSRLAEVVASAIVAGHRPLVLGGGHETAWGTFQGIVAREAEGKRRRHQHRRAPRPARRRTGQLRYAVQPDGEVVRGERPAVPATCCVGVSAASNTAALFATSRRTRCPSGSRRILPLNRPEMDAFRRIADVRGVCGSDPSQHRPRCASGFGDAGRQLTGRRRACRWRFVESLIGRDRHTLKKVVAIDLVELNPSLDIDWHGCTRRRSTRVADLDWSEES